MSRVWVSDEREYRELGEIRYLVTWHLLKDSAEGKEEIDFDTDLWERTGAYKTKAAAVKHAKRLAAGGNTVFGCAHVTKQIVGWFVESDGFAEWQDVGKPEEFS